MMLKFIFISLLAVPFVTLASYREPKVECQWTQSKTALRSVRPQICIEQFLYTLEYKNTFITLSHKGKRFRLEQIPKEFDPKIIGGLSHIGFLPYNLQPYVNRKILLYTSVRRTRGGDGGGLCGSGAEIYLNALDLTNRPKILNRFLIGSCSNSIELVDQDLALGDLGDITVVAGRLTFNFLTYKGNNSQKAQLSRDIRSLDFYDNQKIQPNAGLLK